MMASLCFGFFALALWYIYDGYLRTLKVCHTRRIDTSESASDVSEAPVVTLLVTAYNEADQIRDRIDNLLAQDYPHDRLDVLVASDGSTDGTDQIVLECADPRVRLYRSGSQLGKTATQNQAIPLARGEIIVFSDADTRFDRSFVRRIAAAFADPGVGGADGHLLFIAQAGNDVSQSQGFYWRYELKLREAESRLGIMAVASGACIAVRRVLFRAMDPAIGEDCIVPLDVVAQGYRMVHVSDALAYDHMDNAPDREFGSRVRMTLRNWQGTWSRPELLNPLRHSGIAWALWSHKVLRWLSPFFLLGLIVSANAWALAGAFAGMAAASAVNGFLLLALVGWGTSNSNVRVPLAGTAYSFLLANAGFFVGVIRAMSGHSIHVYRN